MFNGAVFEEAERALAMSEPRTPGSIGGVIPRRASEVGRVGSLQMDGISILKLLKFCSAASSAPSPNSERIKSACVSLAHGLAAPRSIEMGWPVRVCS